MKKCILSLGILLATTSSFGKMTPTDQQYQSLYEAVESSLYADTTARMNLLMLVQGYAYQGVDDIQQVPLEDLKIYSLTAPNFYACISKEYGDKKYQTALGKGLDYYFNQVNKEQFANDLNYLTDKNRQNYFAFMKNYYQLMAKNNALITRVEQATYTGDISEEDVAAIKNLEEQVNKQSENFYDFMAEDLDDLLENHSDKTTPALTELMGLSMLNTPFEESNITSINPMSIYQQNLLDKCHQNYWVDIHSGKIPL